MAQQCGFFNAKLVNGQYDRVYVAEQFAAYFASFIGNGVFGGTSSQLQVIANDNMTVTIAPGKAWINGWWFSSTENHIETVELADGVLNRIDCVVLRWDNTERNMYFKVLKGVPSNSPSKPTLVRNSDYYDLALCYINVNKGVSKIRQQDITDTRLDNTVCGIVTGVVKQADTTDIFRQYVDYLDNFKSDKTTEYTEWFNSIKSGVTKLIQDRNSEFDIWFSNLRLKLDNSPLTSVQRQIDKINGEKVITLEASKWSNTKPYSQTVELNVLEDDVLSMYKAHTNTSTPQEIELWDEMASMITSATVNNGSITFYCGVDKPKETFKIKLRGIES